MLCPLDLALFLLVYTLPSKDKKKFFFKLKYAACKHSEALSTCFMLSLEKLKTGAQSFMLSLFDCPLLIFFIF